MGKIIDKAKLYRGCNISVTGNITIRQPTLGQIIDFGEDEYFDFVYLFTSNHLDYNIITFLTDIGVDFNSVSDWDVFMVICQAFGDASKLIFGDLDFKSFKPYKKDNSDIIYLKNKDDVVIDETLYKILVEYVRIINYIPKPKFTKVRDDPLQKQMAIDDARRQVESAKRKRKYSNDDSHLLPLISALVNCSGFKHDEKKVFDMSIYAFFDAVNRIRVIDNAQHLYQGLYNGCINLKKNPSLKKEMDWMRHI